MASRRSSMTAYEYLVKSVRECSTDSCLIWPYQTDRDGYGRLRMPMAVAGKRVKVAAHRLAYKIVNGNWPKNEGTHSCDNPSCFNPRHIKDETNAMNQAQKAERGRSLRGSMQHDAKLTDDLVRQARAEYVPRRNGFHKLAKKYGVSKHAMRLAVSKLSWRHV